MYFFGIFITVTAIGCSFITIFFCTKLLLDIFWFKKLKKSHDLTLFYFRFLLDIIFSTIIIFFLGSILITMASFQELSHIVETSMFFIFWARYITGSTRAILALLIATDRTWAAYFPVWFFNYRNYISSKLVISIVFMYPFIDGSVLFIYCQNSIQISPGCKNAACVMSDCYLLYWLAYEKIVYTIIIILSLLLSLKLYVWNRYKNVTISWEIKRVNRLALIDTCTNLIFGLIPPFLVTYTRSTFDHAGPLNTSLKILGYSLESYLVSVNLRKNKITNNAQQSEMFADSN